jgi:hypothetical protein
LVLGRWEWLWRDVIPLTGHGVMGGTQSRRLTPHHLMMGSSMTPAPVCYLCVPLMGDTTRCQPYCDRVAGNQKSKHQAIVVACRNYSLKYLDNTCPRAVPSSSIQERNSQLIYIAKKQLVVSFSFSKVIIYPREIRKSIACGGYFFIYWKLGVPMVETHSTRCATNAKERDTGIIRQM